MTVRGLFETHLTVADMPRSVAFYRDVVGLPVALELPERGAAFHWVGQPGRAMLGLWTIGFALMNMKLHIAFEGQRGVFTDAVEWGHKDAEFHYFTFFTNLACDAAPLSRLCFGQNNPRCLVVCHPEPAKLKAWPCRRISRRTLLHRDLSDSLRSAFVPRGMSFSRSSRPWE